MDNCRSSNSTTSVRGGQVKRYAQASVCAAALLLTAQAALAQEVAQADAGVEAVSVTGTRVVRDGYNAPTPVTVIGTEQIQALAPANLADYVDHLPSMMGGEKPDTSSGSLSNGAAGINALNLRSLGVARTLILLDGHRSAPSAATGEVDINTIPQQLVKRVDVVTGGASADYGSDAVGGVVNFILDKEYTGIKGSAEYGETTQGFQPSYKLNATYGTEFAGGKGHFLLSGEFVSTEGIYNYDPPWNKTGYFRVVNPAYKAGSGQPYYLIQSGIGAGQVTPGGLVLNSVTTTGASSNLLRGTYFGVNGTVNQLAFGTTTGQWMIGGDTAITQSNYEGTSSLAAGETRENLFGRVGYYITPDIEVWGQASITRYKGRSYYMQPPQVGGITIKADNAFLPASIRTYMQQNNLASINMGSTDAGFPESGSLNAREAQRYAAGADGTFNLFSTDWKWDLTGQVSITDTREQETAVWNTNYLNNAADAVYVTAQNVGTSGLAVGSIVCRSTLTAPTNGCVPISRIGVAGGLQDQLMGAGSFQKGLNYVMGTPFRTQRLNEQDYSFNVSGNPIEDWAGPISVAFGGEWRLESINGFVPHTPAGSITDYTNGWLFGNYLVNQGHYSVAEGYVETVVPIMQGLDVNGAFRYAAYSTSGGVNTWKLGANYAPLDDIKFRMTYSHDIRAPNLNDLFATGTRRTNTVLIYNTSYTFIQNQRGSQLVGTDLSPEAANSLGAGVVLTPSFIPGLSGAVDYYNITISGAIGTLSAQNVADQCFVENIASACAFVLGDGGVATPGTLTNPGHVPAVGPNLTYINLAPINYAKQKAEGLDFDITYNVPLDSLSSLVGQIPGDLTINALATNYMRNYQNDGINPPTDSAGTNTGGTPSWAYRISATYHTDPWTFFIMGRGVSAGKYNNNWITCTSGCPDYTVAHPTANMNSIPGAFYVDTNVTYSFDVGNVGFDAFFAVKNIFNTDPPLVGSGPDANNTPAYPQTNRDLYDYLGRVFRMGVRFKM